MNHTCINTIELGTSQRKFNKKTVVSSWDHRGSWCSLIGNLCRYETRWVQTAEDTKLLIANLSCFGDPLGVWFLVERISKDPKNESELQNGVSESWSRIGVVLLFDCQIFYWSMHMLVWLVGYPVAAFFLNMYERNMAFSFEASFFGDKSTKDLRRKKVRNVRNAVAWKKLTGSKLEIFRGALSCWTCVVFLGFEVAQTCTLTSGQIIATSHDLTPNGGLVREIPLFQENLGWWNIIIWPADIQTPWVRRYLGAKNIPIKHQTSAGIWKTRDTDLSQAPSDKINHGALSYFRSWQLKCHRFGFFVWLRLLNWWWKISRKKEAMVLFKGPQIACFSFMYFCKGWNPMLFQMDERSYLFVVVQVLFTWREPSGLKDFGNWRGFLELEWLFIPTWGLEVRYVLPPQGWHWGCTNWYRIFFQQEGIKIRFSIPVLVRRSQKWHQIFPDMVYLPTFTIKINQM